METQEEKRKEIMKNIPAEKVVYIDESGIEERIAKDRGWGIKGQKIAAKKSGKYYERSNIIAGYVNKKIIAPLVFYSSCNAN